MSRERNYDYFLENFGAVFQKRYIRLLRSTKLWPFQTSQPLGFNESLFVGAGLVIERLRARIPAGAVGELSSPGLTFSADSYSVSVPPPCYRSGKLKTPVILPKMQVAARSHLNTHTSLTQRSRSGLTVPLCRHCVGTYQETSSHSTRQGTFSHSRLSSLSHYGLILA